jgi:hypothetical protein
MVVRDKFCCTTNCVLKKSSQCNYHLYILYFMVVILMPSLQLPSLLQLQYGIKFIFLYGLQPKSKFWFKLWQLFLITVLLLLSL